VRCSTACRWVGHDGAFSSGSLERVADSRDHFASRLDEEGRADDWLMIPQVDKLVSSGRALQPGECYGFLHSPIVGGDYTPENTRTVPVAEHYAATGALHERLKSIPDGTRIKLTINE
jgi:hypothetical protein